jgi:EmrB/QacA subfamily drug resistance transporter
MRVTLPGSRTWAGLMVEPARPASIRDRPNAYWYVVATVCIGAFLGQLDTSIVTLALPTLGVQFHAGVSSVELVALAYLVVLVATVAAIGRFADMFGRKLLYIYGFGVFTLASVACGLAPTLPVLVGFRVVQAIGAAMLQANSVALIATAVPRSKLGRAIGAQGAAQAVGLALGPLVGGLLIAVGGWRLIFFVNVPAGAAGMILGWFLLPRSRDLRSRVPFDWHGFGLFAPAVVALLIGLNLIAHGGSAEIGAWPALAIAAIAGALFFRHARRTADPMIDLGLFRRASFSTGIVAGLLSYVVLFGVLFVVPFFLEQRQGLSAKHAGFVLTALPAALIVVAPFAGRVSDRLGARLPTAAGMAVTAAALGMLAAQHRSVPVVVVLLAVLGLGVGAFTPANNASIMASAPRAQSGAAGGVLNMTRGLGGALGVAVVGIVYGSGSSTTGGRFTLALTMLAVFAVIAATVAGASAHKAD